MAYDYDPAKVACDPTYSAANGPRTQTYGRGPAGRTNNIEHNEKGILETGLHEVIALHQNSYMSSNHDAYRMDIYATTSIGDND